MNAKEFYDTVVEMRKAQKNYFASRKMPLTAQQHLQESKRLERIIDQEIERVQQLGVEKLTPKIDFDPLDWHCPRCGKKSCNTHCD